MAEQAAKKSEAPVAVVDDKAEGAAAPAPASEGGASATSSDGPVATPARSRRKLRHSLRFFRPLIRLVLMVILPVCAAVWGALVWGESMRWVTTENAYVKADVIAISADVKGRIIDIDVRENERVSGGQVLFRIDPRPFEIEIQEAKAELDRVRTEVDSMRAAYRSGNREVEQLRERVRFLDGEHKRQQTLTRRGVGTNVKLDEAQHLTEMAKRQVETVRERNQMLLAELGGNVNIKVGEHPKFLRALAALDRAELDFARTNVLAPSDGVVGNIKLQAGEYVEDGDALFSLVQVDRPWIEANLKETQLTYVKFGQAVDFTIDSYPDVSWKGRVASIAPATGAEFSLLPPQNASGNWVKVVQRIPVRIEFEPQEGLPKLRAGMTVTVEIDTERDRSAPTMARELAEWLGIEGWVPEGWYARLEGL